MRSFSNEFWAALIGAIVGGGLTIFGQWLNYYWTTKSQRKQQDQRKVLLRKMLDNPSADSEGWRKMETLSGVIGASREETARLLVECGARSSLKKEDVWAYVSEKPLPDDDDK